MGLFLLIFGMFLIYMVVKYGAAKTFRAFVGVSVIMITLVLTMVTLMWLVAMFST